MTLSNFAYLSTVLVFMGLPIAILWRYYRRVFFKNRKLIALAAISSLPLAALESLAMKWGAWFYNHEKALYFSQLLQPETFILAPAIMIFGTALTLIMVENVDRGLRPINLKAARNRKLLHLRLQKVFAIAGRAK